ncbi:MAG: rod shape-determining protein MreC [Candidatus Omnitrophica bacterium]|nr:rod shape-determining protein MreC [Candidatus Omnitrophota bacterium]
MFFYVRKFKKKNLIYFLITFALLLLFSISLPYFRVSLLNILNGPLRIFTLIRRELEGIIFYHRNLIQLEQLKKQVDLLQQNINTINELRQENQRLKNLLNLKHDLTLKVIAAKVIARSPDNWSSLIIIDKGRVSGIKKGMPVMSYLGLVGRVVETGETTSKIVLINDPDFAVSGIVQRSRQEGLICGSLGEYLLMRYLPKDADIQVQDVIVTSGLTPRYPKGILIGRVLSLADDFSGMGRYAIVKPAVNLSRIEEVLVIVQ